ncbi:MAG: hypothetical protein J6M66_13000 [Lachnospiraceae bacterium]|nr:hypothetical protein [Lachnospiraceae bacterium]
MKNKIRYFSISTIFFLWMIFSVSACKGKDMNTSGENKNMLINMDQSDTAVTTAEKTEELTGYDPEHMPKEMYFIVEDVFTITHEGDKYSLVVGCPVNGTVSVNQEVDILYSDGRIKTKVVGLEDAHSNHPTTVGEFENVAIWLDKYVGDFVKAGDLLVNRDEGVKTDSIDCVVVVLDEGHVIEDGMNVTVELGSYRASSITKLHKNMGDGCFLVHYNFDEEVAMVYGQIIKIYDENNNEIAIGRLVLRED